ncbi:cellulose synthase-like protein B4 [Pyrus x bretschneideri]|uniref:cellulose synthase-like protein B4 n=1 Tax=Pyrus x bretschneideri TaxID=225117 RepID=UPI00202EA2D8|nr:cellulose synthase-like protein B4 [Pyrus x bretschneideri]
MKDEYEKLCQEIEDAVQKLAPLNFSSDTHRQQEPSHYNQGDMGEQKENFSWSGALGYVARKKHPIHAHHYKAGAINTLVRIICLTKKMLPSLFSNTFVKFVNYCCT